MTLQYEYVPGIGLLLNENGKRTVPNLTQVLAIIAREHGPGAAVGCECTSCAAKRVLDAGGLA